MTIEQKKKMLMLDHKLDPVDDFYVDTDEHGTKIILRRSGIDKLEQEIQMNFTIENLQVVPYGDKVSVTILGRGVSDGVVARSLVQVTPDNCTYPQYAEVAEKRCRHRIILKLARLYEHNIFSQIESDKWMETRNQYISAVSEVVKMLDVNTKTNKKEQGSGAARSTAGAKAVR